MLPTREEMFRNARIQVAHAQTSISSALSELRSTTRPVVSALSPAQAAARTQARDRLHEAARLLTAAIRELTDAAEP